MERCGNCNDETERLYACPCYADDCPIVGGVCRSCFRSITRNLIREAERRIEEREAELDRAEAEGRLREVAEAIPSVEEQTSEFIRNHQAAVAAGRVPDES